ncbi:tRNA (adenosine(37)-N6)-threonylcarbamoyltransferase complex transferase subunit TsaD, partial [Mycoplasmopsis pullorum]
MLILGIETSHDDTSIALLEDGKVIDMLSISQIDIFKEFGGTIPEISSREHVKNIALIHEYF